MILRRPLPPCFVDVVGNYGDDDCCLDDGVAVEEGHQVARSSQGSRAPPGLLAGTGARETGIET